MRKESHFAHVESQYQDEKNDFEGCERDGKNAKNRRTYETMNGDKVASGPRKTRTMTPQQRQVHSGNQWNVVQNSAVGSNAIPTRQHPELAQVHSACSGRP